MYRARSIGGPHKTSGSVCDPTGVGRRAGRGVCRSLAWLLAFYLTVPALADESPYRPAGLLSRPRLSTELVEQILNWFEKRPGGEELNSLRQALERMPSGEVAGLVAALEAIASGGVWRGRAALDRLVALQRSVAATGSGRLAAWLLLVLGKAQLWSGHNAAALASLEQVPELMRTCGDRRGEVLALESLAGALVRRSRRPAEALSVINELLLAAARAGMATQVEGARLLQEEWRRAVEETGDYFGRARARLQIFPSSLGIPEDADLVGWRGGRLYLNGDTDDQVNVSRPEWVSFDGLFTRRQELPEAALELRGSLLDAAGRLWAATNRGLFVTDGVGWRQYANPELADEEGNEFRHWQERRPAQVKLVPLSLPSNVVNELKQGPGGDFYAATQAGVAVFREDGRVLEILDRNNAPLPLAVERVAAAPDGTLTVAWSDAYAVREANGRWLRRDFVLPPESGRPHPKLYGLLVDAAGYTWVHGLGGALQLQGGQVLGVVDRRLAPVTRNINHVLRAGDGAYWFASTDGLCRRQGWHCDTLDARRWLAAEWALDLLEDAQGAVWVSVYQGGLYRLLPPAAEHFGVPEGLRQPVNYALAELDGYIYLTNGEGLARLDPANGIIDSFVSEEEGLPTGELSKALRLSDGRLALWGYEVLGGRGLVIFDGRRGRAVGRQQGLPDQPVLSFCERQPGRLLVATRTGFAEVETASGEVQEASEASTLAGVRPSDVCCQPGGPLWVLASDGRLWRVEQGRAEEIRPEELRLDERPTRLLGKPGVGPLAVGRHSLSLWQEDGWHRLDIRAGDFDFRVRDLESDGEGRLYVSTEGGVYVFWRGDWVRLGEAEGLVSDTAFGLLHQGDSLWIAGHGGAARWRWPQAAEPETFLLTPAGVWHTDATGRARRWQKAVGETPAGFERLVGLSGTFDAPAADLGPFLARESEPVVASPACQPTAVTDLYRVRGDRLEVEVTAGVPFLADPPDALTYRLSLDGGEWRRLEGRRVVFEDLAEGGHVLEARATDRRLRTDTTPARWCFVVERPLPFWAAASLAGAGGLVLFLGRRRLWWLVRRMGQRKFRPIEPSPFCPRRPATGESFRGRVEELRALTDLVRQGGTVAVVWGERGSGKRSLLTRFKEEMSAAGHLLVEVDLALGALGGDVVQAVALAAEQLSQAAAGTVQPTKSGEPAESVPDAYRLLDLALEEVGVRLPGQRVVLLLTNTEVLGVESGQGGGPSGYFFPFLRSLVQRHRHLAVVLTAEGRWFELNARFSQLFAFATPVAAGRLDDGTVEEIFRRALQGKALLAEAAWGRLVELVGGHPTLVQVLGEELVKLINQRRSNVCGVRQVEEAARRIWQDPTGVASLVWLDRKREERLVLSVACAEEGRGNWDLAQLCRRIQHAGAGLLFEEARRAVLALEKDGTLTAGESHRVRGEIFRRWVAAQQTLASLLDEAREYVGRYQLLEQLGSGGMGVVYRARDLASGEQVALKLLRPELGESEQARRRFLREARLGSRIVHPNLVRILDYGEQGGRLFLAMEFCQGITLGRWRRAQGTVSPRQVANLGRELAAALEALHAAGIVHRDIKSENIMVLSGAEPVPHPPLKLMDFGLALGQEQSQLTRTGTVLGTVGYMSPEQARGENVDRRSDLYSLGAVLYELCAGTPPFSGNEAAALHAVIYEPLPSLSERAPQTPPGLVKLIEELLAKDPSARPATAAEVGDRLAALVDELPDGGAEDRAAQTATVAKPPSQLDVHTIEQLRGESALLATLASTVHPSSSGELPAEASLLMLRLAADLARGSFSERPGEVLETVALALRADQVLLCEAEDGERPSCRLAWGVEPEAVELERRPVLRGLVENCLQQKGAVLFRADKEFEANLSAAAACTLWGSQVSQAALVAGRLGAAAPAFDRRELELITAAAHLLGMAREREALQQRLGESERLAAVGQALAGVAHDLRGPMAIISGYAELVAESTATSEQRQYLGTITSQVEQMNQMILNLLAFARGERNLQLNQVSFQELEQRARQLLQPLAQTMGAELILQVEPGLATLDLGRTERIIYNLGKNGLEAAGRGGRVEISLRPRDGGLDLRVKDSGPGIPEPLRRQLFQPFKSQGKRGGTGLGLALVKRFTEDQGGQVTWESTPGAGTTFAVYLPGAHSTPPPSHGGTTE